MQIFVFVLDLDRFVSSIWLVFRMCCAILALTQLASDELDPEIRDSQSRTLQVI